MAHLFQRKDKRTELEKEIDRTTERMAEIEDQDSDEYTHLQSILEKLIGSYVKYAGVTKKEKISPNTMLVVVGGIIEIVVIMTYERFHVITTKAFGRVLRGRV